jgi:hypothetical protein
MIAGRRALNLYVVVVEANALPGQLFDALRGYRSAVHPETPQPTLTTRMNTTLGFFSCAIAGRAANIVAPIKGATDGTQTLA